MKTLLDGFVFPGAPARVVFGQGVRAQAGPEIARLGMERPLFLSTPRGADDARPLMAGLDGAGLFAGAAMHTPVGVTERALRALADGGHDGMVAVGGGSATGLSKALALRTDLPQLVLATTYAGSEMTAVVGETEAGVKTTRRSEKIRPETVIYDVELTLALSPQVSIVSGLNAMAHAVEALYAPDRSPLSTTLALAGLEAMIAALPKLESAPADRDARAQALYGAWMCGMTLDATTMGLHHKLCHVLGGSFGLPHAETHAVVLPYATAFLELATEGLLTPVAKLFGSETAAQGLRRFAASLGAPHSLSELGFPADGVSRAVEIALRTPYNGPRPLTPEGLAQLLSNAAEGRF